MGKIRKFKTGATRDTNEGKYDYEGFLSPIVIEAYGKYMHKHRKQSDGTLRDSDNWQKHFGKNHYSVCMKSLWRHFLDLWFLHRGYKRFDKKDGHEITKEEVLMAILFNDMAYADKLLKEKLYRVTKNEKLFTVKHTICEFVFAVSANQTKKLKNLLYNCICPYCKRKLKNKYIIMKEKK